MSFEIYLLKSFILKVNDNSSGGKMSIILPPEKEIGHIWQRKIHDQELKITTLFKLS